jgi:hypothetical protein
LSICLAALIMCHYSGLFPCLFYLPVTSFR